VCRCREMLQGETLNAFWPSSGSAVKTCLLRTRCYVIRFKMAAIALPRRPKWKIAVISWAERLSSSILGWLWP